MNEAAEVRAFESWRLCSVGVPYSVTVRTDSLSARRSLGAAVSSNLTDFVSATMLDSDTRPVLTGRVGDQIVLRMPDRDRQPWWWLSPVFRGQIVSDGRLEARLVGVLRVRLRTALAIHALAAVIAFFLGTPLLGLALIAGYWAEVVLVLPRQARLLDRRIKDVVGRISSRD